MFVCCIGSWRQWIWYAKFQGQWQWQPRTWSGQSHVLDDWWLVSFSHWGLSKRWGMRILSMISEDANISNTMVHRSLSLWVASAFPAPYLTNCTFSTFNCSSALGRTSAEHLLNLLGLLQYLAGITSNGHSDPEAKCSQTAKDVCDSVTNCFNGVANANSFGPDGQVFFGFRASAWTRHVNPIPCSSGWSLLLVEPRSYLFFPLANFHIFQVLFQGWLRLINIPLPISQDKMIEPIGPRQKVILLGQTVFFELHFVGFFWFTVISNPYMSFCRGSCGMYS